jgi:hypothetical protein
VTAGARCIGHGLDCVAGDLKSIIVAGRGWEVWFEVLYEAVQGTEDDGD